MSDQPTVTTYSNGRVEYRLDGLLHRLDGPAVKDGFGGEEYWHHGLRHRANDLPAIVYANGDRSFWRFGKRYRFVDHSSGEVTVD